MDDINCPYCNKGLEIDHDDGYGYCEKTFVYTTSITYYYEAEKADCLNGSEHKMRRVVHYPNTWSKWKRCEVCGEETGKYN